MQIGLYRVARERFKRGFCAEYPRRPVEFRVEPPERTEDGPAEAERQGATQALFVHMPAVTTVTGEILISPVAGQCHRHPLARELTHPVGGDRGAVGIGFIVEPGQRIQQVEIVTGDDPLEMVGVVALRYLPGKICFIELRHVKADRAGIYRITLQLRHRGHYRAGVDTTGQKGTKWNLGHKTDIHRLAYTPVEFLATFRFCAGLDGLKGYVPIFVLIRHWLATLKQQRMTRAQFVDVAIDGLWLRNITQREVILDCLRLELPRQARMRLEHLELRTEDQRVASHQ